MTDLIPISTLETEITKFMSLSLLYKLMKNGKVPSQYFKKKARGTMIRREYLTEFIDFLNKYERGGSND